MKMPLLKIENLEVSLSLPSCVCKILEPFSLEIGHGEVVGLIGESGSGKSTAASAILGLLPAQYHLQGSIQLEGKELLKMDSKALNHIRGNNLSLIMQDPSLALNPLMTIGEQLTEGLISHKKLCKRQALDAAACWLSRVKINDPLMRMKQYPHEMSGGMKQRILIAMALISAPKLVIADEPTTALDVTVQKEILELLGFLQQEEKMALLLISHDLGVIAALCKKVIVLYAGQIIETGSVEEIFSAPKHPYTQALLQSKRSLISSSRKEDNPLFFLKGFPPSPSEKHPPCRFLSRCPHAMNICAKSPPPVVHNKEAAVRCWLHTPACCAQKAHLNI